jgi:hypothetical protein
MVLFFCKMLILSYLNRVAPFCSIRESRFIDMEVLFFDIHVLKIGIAVRMPNCLGALFANKFLEKIVDAVMMIILNYLICSVWSRCRSDPLVNFSLCAVIVWFPSDWRRA